MSVNKAILIGNVGRDPEIRYVDGKPVASFSLATTERSISARERSSTLRARYALVCGRTRMPSSTT